MKSSPKNGYAFIYAHRAEEPAYVRQRFGAVTTDDGTITEHSNQHHRQNDECDDGNHPHSAGGA